MVRVKCPPGGSMKMNSAEPETKSKAVRVLKPPGGGSSIMFGNDEDDFMKRTPKSADSNNSASVTLSNDAVSPTPSTLSTPSTVSMPSEASSKESSTPPSSATATEAEPRTPMSTEDKNVDSAPSKCPADSPTPITTTTNTTTTNGTSNSIDSGVSMSSPSASSQKSTTQSTINTTTTNNNTNNNNNSNGLSLSADTSNSPITLPSSNGNNISNGHDHAGSTPSSPTGISLASPLTPSSIKSGVTKDRLFGENAVAASPKTDTPPRKIKDHMRSSIFSAPDENTHRGQSNGTTGCNVSKQSSVESTISSARIEPPAPRGRVPPGGFSTKLW